MVVQIVVHNRTCVGTPGVIVRKFTLGGAKAIVMDGGLSTSYAPLNAWTTLQGILTIQKGSLTVDRLIVK